MTAYNKTASPHISSKKSTVKIYWTQSACLLPLILLATIYFSWRAPAMVLVAVIAGQLAEGIGCFLTGRQYQGYLGRNFYGSLLFAMMLSPETSFVAIFLSFFLAVLIGSEFLGGPGQSIFNHALLARIFVSFAPTYLGEKIFSPRSEGWAPHLLSSWHASLSERLPVWTVSFLGNQTESLGEISGLLIFLCGLVLFFQKWVRLETALVFLATVVATSWAYGLADWPFSWLAPGFLFCATFILGDTETMPHTKKGRMTFAFFAGLLVCALARKMAFFEAMALGILSMNLLSNWIDFYSQPRGRKPV